MWKIYKATFNEIVEEFWQNFMGFFLSFVLNFIDQSMHHNKAYGHNTVKRHSPYHENQ